MKLPSFLLLLFLHSHLLFGQYSLGKIQLIHNPYLSYPDKIITEKANKSNILHSSSFQAIAFPIANLANEIISLDYENQFIVTVGKRQLFPDLPRWQLIPIVNFANSSFQSVYTAWRDTKRGETGCKYHPAFLDNLLGLRLFQADLLKLPEFIWDIPRDKNGNYLLAQSEKKFMPQKNEELGEMLHEKLNSKIKYSSYILTDRGVDMIFGIEGSKLKFFGNPYYYFMRTNIDTAEINRIRIEAESHYKSIEDNAMAFLKEKYTPNLNPRTNMAGLLRALEENKQNEYFNPFNMHYIKNALDKLEELNTQVDEEMGLNRGELEEFSNLFKQQWSLLKLYNPLVYTAIENISHWAAFFRYIRLTNPNSWNAFIRKLENVKMSDTLVIKTPTSYKIVQ